MLTHNTHSENSTRQEFAVSRQSSHCAKYLGGRFAEYRQSAWAEVTQWDGHEEEEEAHHPHGHRGDRGPRRPGMVRRPAASVLQEAGEERQQRASCRRQR